MRGINILGKGTPGLLADARILAGALTRAGLSPRSYRARTRNLELLPQRLLRSARQGFGGRRDAANLFLESVLPDWPPLAEFNALIPNQEWCRPETLARLGELDLVLCKTRCAHGIFKSRVRAAEFVGFTSEDRFIPGFPKDDAQVLHAPGQSAQKGTAAVLAAWSKHPEWPVLNLVASIPLPAWTATAPNIRVFAGVMPAGELAALQNRCALHLCPSEAEGYGHYIGEALGCGAVVITTDAPPMNELVAPGRGLLAAFRDTAPQSLGTNYFVDEAALEAAIEGALALSPARRRALGEAAREWFLANRREFEGRLREVLLPRLF